LSCAAASTAIALAPRAHRPDGEGGGPVEGRAHRPPAACTKEPELIGGPVLLLRESGLVLAKDVADEVVDVRLQEGQELGGLRVEPLDAGAGAAPACGLQ
jgi:hypothetical protein